MDTNNIRLVKDLFGLSSNEAWGIQKWQITKEDIQQEVQRFKSPIFFKPLKSKERDGCYDVYFEFRRIHPKMLGREFEIMNSNNKGQSPLYLSTPDEFDRDDFMSFVQKHNRRVIKNY